MKEWSERQLCKPRKRKRERRQTPSREHIPAHRAVGRWARQQMRAWLWPAAERRGRSLSCGSNVCPSHWRFSHSHMQAQRYSYFQLRLTHSIILRASIFDIVLIMDFFAWSLTFKNVILHYNIIYIYCWGVWGFNFAPCLPFRGLCLAHTKQHSKHSHMG